MLITAENHKKIRMSQEVEAVPGKNGAYTLLLKKDGAQRLVHSKYDPVREAAGQADRILSGLSKRTVIVFGLGMGYHIDELLHRLPEGGEVCVFEPCPYACLLCAGHRGTELFRDGRVKLFAFSGEKELRRDVEAAFSLENCDAFSFFAHPVYTSVYPQEHDALVKAINDVAGSLAAQKNTIDVYGAGWCANYLLNFEHLFESAAVKGLFGLFKGKAAIIVSAGPSLSKNIGLLKDVGDRAVIICTDTAYKALEAINVRPHLLVSVSGNSLTYEKLRGADYSETPLVYKSQSSHDIIKNHGGRKFYAKHSNVFLNDALRELAIDSGTISSFGSVACSCLDLAVQMGVKTLLLIGQDFALSGGESYAKGVFGYVDDYSLENFSEETADIYGNTVKTLKNLNMYRKWFEQYIAKCQDVRFIDATEGGALIAGTEIMSFADALGLLNKPLGIKGAIENAFLDGLAFGGSRVKTELEKKHKKAFYDFLEAKEITKGLIRKYEEDKPPCRADLIDALDMVEERTRAVTYAILALLIDIKNMNIGKAPAAELAILKSVSLRLEGLTGCFEKAALAKEE